MVMRPISYARQLLDYANIGPTATVRGYSLRGGRLMSDRGKLHCRTITCRIPVVPEAVPPWSPAEEHKAPQKTGGPGLDAVDCRELVKTFDGGAVRAVDGVSIAIRSNSFSRFWAQAVAARRRCCG